MNTKVKSLKCIGGEVPKRTTADDWKLLKIILKAIMRFPH
jgi:hypothetical protein